MKLNWPTWMILMPKTYAYLHHRTFPYYKVQLWDDISLCWRDRQKAYHSIEDARAALPARQKARLMCITEDGRQPQR